MDSLTEQKLHRIKLTPAQKEAVYARPLAEQYAVICVNIRTRCRVWQHVLVDPSARDYRQVKAVAIAYTEKCDCWINPEVDQNAMEARKKIFPGIEDNANPDLYTEKYGYIDVKSPLNKSNIVRNANSACRQSAIAVLTDLMLDAEKESINQKEVAKFSARIFSEQNRNHCGHPNYTRDEVHWFIRDTFIKCNRPKKKNSSPA